VHGPIRIDGNGEFTTANGVRGGGGTPADPFVIEAWDITAAGTAFEIRNTDAPFVIRDVVVQTQLSTTEIAGVHLENVRHGRVERIVARNNAVGVEVRAAEDAAIADPAIASNLTGISAGNGSRGISVAAHSSDVSLLGNPVPGTEYIAVSAYQVRNLTVADNSVDASGIMGIVLDVTEAATVPGNRVSRSNGLGLTGYPALYPIDWGCPWKRHLPPRQPKSLFGRSSSPPCLRDSCSLRHGGDVAPPHGNSTSPRRPAQASMTDRTRPEERFAKGRLTAAGGGPPTGP
jgi:hypothetical protein